MADIRSEQDLLSVIRSAGSDLFHAGLVVDDVEDAMAALGAVER